MSSKNDPAVDIVTLCFNDSRHFANYIEALSLLDYPHEKLKSIVVDNGSSDNSVEVLHGLLPLLPFSYELVEAGQNLGFAGGCNRGAMQGNAPFILFLNPDTRVERDMIRRLLERAQYEPQAGLIEAAQYPIELAKWRDPVSNYTDWCSGAALLARREAFVQVGMFDNFFYPIYCEDVDLSWRMWLAGWKCVYEPSARVEHHTMRHDSKPNPNETRLSTRFSFAMRLIYDTPSGVINHIIRGIRYLFSPRSDHIRRKGIVEGFWTIISSFGYLMRRRSAMQSALRLSDEKDRFVFTEWYYGRWMT